ncbi:MAG: peroxide stress protein YaaA [Candidatus Hydrogenedentota bacterium]
MIILLPPSEGKSVESGRGVFRDLHPELVRETKGVLKHLRGLDSETLGKFYCIKNPEKATEAHRLNLGVLKAGGMRALERNTGVVYGHLDYGSLRAKRRAIGRVHIVSGMFGLIPGGSLIPNYKLPMNTWLARHWRESNTERLQKLRGRQAVLSLLPASYSKAIGVDDAIHVRFKVGGGKKLAGHFGKAIKGRFVRYLIENDITSMKGFDGFVEDGFRFDGTDFIQG